MILTPSLAVMQCYDSFSHGFFGGCLVVDIEGDSELSMSGICRIPGTGLPDDINSTISSKVGPLTSILDSLSSLSPAEASCSNHGLERSGSVG